MGSAGYTILVVGMFMGLIGCIGSPSTARRQGPGEVDRASGDGRGVISTSGPSPGEVTADPGESELTLERAADSADRTLELRRGSPAFSIVYCAVSG